MSLDNLDDVLGGGGGATAFNVNTPMGTTFRGPIIDANVAQIIDIQSKKPKFWDDGRPQQQIVIRIQTDHRDDADDDGVRALYIKTWGDWKKALTDAQINGGFDRLSAALAPGNIFSDTYYADKPNQGLSATKLHRYEITRGSSPALDAAVAAAPAQQQYQQPIAQPAPVQQQYQQPAQYAAPVQQQYQQPVATAPAAAADPWATPAPAQQVAPPVAVPTAAPVAAAPAPAPAAADPVDTARQLIALGLPDNVIEAQTGLAGVVIAAIRGQAAA